MPTSRKFRVALAVSLVAAFVLMIQFIGVYLVIRWGIESALAPVTDLSTYPTHRQFLGDTSAHFPEVTPSSAQNVQMLFVPGFLQGSTRLELRFTLSRSDASALIARFPADKEMTAPLPESVSSQYCELLKTTEQPAVPRFKELVDQYRVFVIYDTGNWNHPNMGGVLIDPVSGDVVYFAEH